MKERKIKIIIALMSLAVLGLIVIQVFWILHAVSIEKMRFETNVNEALTKVVEKADKIETASVVLNQLVPQGNSLIVFDPDSTNSKNHFAWNTRKEVELNSAPRRKLKIEYTGSADSSLIHVITTGITDTVVNITQVADKNSKFDSFIVKKSNLVRTVVDELILRSEDVDRELFVSESTLDSLLKSELNNKGITTNYYFSISTNDKGVKFFDTNTVEKVQTAQAHKVQLNPDDVFHEASFLSVYFPDKNFFIFKSIAAVLAISAILIIVIIAVFYKTIQMLLRQKRLTEIKNELINNITHEFKTPISTISLACEALNEPVLLENPNSVSRYTSMINDENKRLSNLVENLLSAAAIEKDKFKLKKESIDMHKILRELVDNYRIKFEQKDVNVEMNMNAAYPHIKADKFHVTNCVNNLIDNAFKYTKVKPHILIETDSDESYFTFKITDNGIGIRKQDLERIFETFFRVPTGNIHDVKGNGIGLSYVKKMVEAHGGFVSVKSKVDHGSTFTVRLPYE